MKKVLILAVLWAVMSIVFWLGQAATAAFIAAMLISEGLTWPIVVVVCSFLWINAYASYSFVSDKIFAAMHKRNSDDQ